MNEKADAFEAFDFLLTCIHSWVRQSQSQSENTGIVSKDDSQEAISSKLAKLSKIECDQNNSCFIHKMFYLSKVSKRECTTCKIESDQEFRQDRNLFAETVSVPELVQQLDDLAK